MVTEKRLFVDDAKFIREDFDKRLIRLDDALRVITPENATSLPDNQLVILLTARKKLKSVPIVDAEEVVHGRWLTLEEYAQKIGADPTGYIGGWSFCSECEQQMRTIYGWNYCPNCGAKMDGEKK